MDKNRVVGLLKRVDNQNREDYYFNNSYSKLTILKHSKNGKRDNIIDNKDRSILFPKRDEYKGVAHYISIVETLLYYSKLS